MEMRLDRKITIAFSMLGCAIIAILCVFSLVLYLYIAQFIKKDFISSYKGELLQLLDTLTEFEKATEIMGINALSTLKAIDQQSGLPSNKKLTLMAKQLSVTHLAITNAAGWFIRATNHLPRPINIFKYGPDYSKLLNGTLNLSVSPLVPGVDEKQQEFYKYITIPNFNRTRLLQATIHFDYIEKLLSGALKNNQHLANIFIYTPTGQLLGSVHRQKPIKNVQSYQVIRLSKSMHDRYNCSECTIKGVADKNGNYYYTVIADISTLKIDQITHYLAIIITIIFLLASLFCILMTRILAKRYTARLYTLREKMSEVLAVNKTLPLLSSYGQDEITDLSNHFDKLMTQLHDSQQQLIVAEKAKTITAISTQVAHDIRSPLAALEIASQEITSLDEENRIIIRNATQRITDIANNLLTQYKSGAASSEVTAATVVSKEPIASLLEKIISEKRTQYRDKELRITLNVHHDARGSFAKINSVEFSRVISNLINNAVEAITDAGNITVNLAIHFNKLRIDIIDNGCGISAEVLNQISSKQSHGLGISHAITCIESWQGHHEITSVVEQGTTVSIELPLTAPDEWFLSKVTLMRNSHLVILDDDDAIHAIWNKRFKTILTAHDQITIFHFKNVHQLQHYCHNQPSQLTQYFIDYELLSSAPKLQKITGTMLIAQFKIQPFATLVTSLFEDSTVRATCQELGCKILPKSFVSYVPINVLDGQPDLIFLDDNEALTNAWQLQAKQKGQRLVTFNAVEELYTYLSSTYPLNQHTPIYLDSSLAANIRGEELACELFAKGYSTLYLATGYDKSKYPHNKAIKDIVGKEFPL